MIPPIVLGKKLVKSICELEVGREIKQVIHEQFSKGSGDEIIFRKLNDGSISLSILTEG